ncbi:probable proton-coupled zinc antiporter SLC30A3 [Emydura macquarii macquarii]|uniref:probable proton-coupled zinc antiporter SLC30A3 n=1 Tax=Emydura macquarii macquarii TaxID=1129001 RepID=UPI00352ACB06
MEPPAGAGDPERARLGSAHSRCSASRRLQSLFAGPQEPFPGLPLEPSPAPAAPELEQRLARHCHPAPPSPSRSGAEEQAGRQLGIACAICILFMIGEVVGGYLAHSLAIMTDAAHLLTDVGSMAVSLFSLWVSARPATKTMSFGWHRSETLGALASVLSIWIVTGVLVYLASARLVSNDYEINARAMLATAACAVGVNLIMACVLHQASPGCSHGRGYEQIPERHGCRGPAMGLPPGHTSVRAAFVHVLGDLLQSLGVLTAATVIYVEPRYKIADPISTFLFSLFVLGSTLPIFRDVVRVLMEGAPRGVEFGAVKDVLLAVNGVKGAHDLHLWALTLSHRAVSVHLAVDAGADPDAVLREATAHLQSTFDFVSCTVQVERHLEDMATCRQCQDPRD